MRTRRRRWLSETLPSSQDPYSGVVGQPTALAGHRLQDPAQPLRDALVGVIVASA